MKVMRGNERNASERASMALVPSVDLFSTIDYL